MSLLPSPPTGSEAATAWVTEHLGHLACDPPHASPRFRGGQAAADAALATLDLTGYARTRNQVLPESARGASQISPYVRHGLLTLAQLWQAAGDAPAQDTRKYRDELLWQEYARHVYARLGRDLGRSLRTEPPVTSTADPWDREMACMDATVDDLETDGWLVNQTRMWLASQWTVRGGRAWREGEDRFYVNLLDGSRAANRLGWQWTTGASGCPASGSSSWPRRSPSWTARCGWATR